MQLYNHICVIKNGKYYKIINYEITLDIPKIIIVAEAVIPKVVPNIFRI